MLRVDILSVMILLPAVLPIAKALTEGGSGGRIHLVDPIGDNSTIVIGYFLQPEPRIAVIGMAIAQALSDGLLPGHGFE
jgi:hypothetical protein